MDCIKKGGEGEPEEEEKSSRRRRRIVHTYADGSTPLLTRSCLQYFLDKACRIPTSKE
jgi:hypothetical protein